MKKKKKALNIHFISVEHRFCFNNLIYVLKYFHELQIFG